MAKIQTDYSKPARTRMAPSPTGELHLGSLRTILYNYALAKKTHGQFVFRIEDTDTKRAVEGSIDRLLDGVKEFGITWDEGPRVGGEYGPYFQLEREKQGIYKKEYDKLLEEGKVYRCFCTAERLDEMRRKIKAQGKVAMYDKHCRNLSQDEIEKNLKEGKSYTLRIKMPEREKIEFNDPMRGKMTWNSNDVDDYILVKSNGVPTYHGAVVIDDYLMKITHVFRGAEWIATTPVYITLAKYLGYETPEIFHVSAILNPVGKGKLSKRKNGDIAFTISYIEKGYPTQALLNFLMFLGWSHTDEKINILSLEEFCEAFTLERLQPQPPKLDFTKLDWYGGQYIRMMSVDQLFENISIWFEKIQNNEELKKSAEVWKERFNTAPHFVKEILRLTQDRLRKYSDLFEQAEFFYSKPVITDDFDWSKTKHEKEECLGTLPGLQVELEKVVSRERDENFDERFSDSGRWTQESWEKAVRDYADICGWKHGDMFMLLRIGVVGSPFSPNLLESMNLIGAEECLKRIDSID